MRVALRLSAAAAVVYAIVAYWMFRPTPSMLARTVAGGRCGASSFDGTEWTPTDAWFGPDALATLFVRPADVRFWEARFGPRTWRLAEIDVPTPAS